MGGGLGERRVGEGQLRLLCDRDEMGGSGMPRADESSTTPLSRLESISLRVFTEGQCVPS